MAAAAEKCVYTPRGAVTNADLDKASKAAEKYTESLKKSLAFLEEKGEKATNALDEIENDPTASESKKNLAKTKSLELKRMLEKSAELRKRMSSTSPATLQAGEQVDTELENALKAAEDIQQLK